MNFSSFSGSSDCVLSQEYLQLSASRPVRMWYHDYASGFRRHSHIFTELVMIADGSITHELFDSQGNYVTEDMEAGDFLVVPPGLVHGYREGHKGQVCRRIDICYLAEWFLWDLDLLWAEGLVPLFFASHLFRRPENLRIWKFRLSSAEIAQCEGELADIEEEYRESETSLLMIRSTFFKLLVRLARAWRRQTPQSDVHFRPEVWSALQTIDTLIKEGSPFRIESFAHDIGMTPKSFARIFHVSTGLTPSEYFSRRRTQHAANLLLDSPLSISQIAARLGYCDSAHLSRAFSRNEGVSPLSFRKQYRGSR